MGDFKKKNKQVKQCEVPQGKSVQQIENPEGYYNSFPSWKFHECDTKYWSLFSREIRDVYWSTILPYLQDMEKLTWKNILIDAKKQNHSIPLDALNKKALDRLIELHIETESLISLRLSGKHRIYGHILNSALHILWIDFEHGDTTTCVCRSKLKHT